MNAVRPQSLPFKLAFEFLRRKVNLPTKRWTDLMGEMHSRAFVVAGAMKDALVEDFHDAIDDAIKGELGYGDFKKQFDEIVAKHGWSYNGERGWRTKVIYNTNLSSAYAAGRERQMQDSDVRAAFPNKRYRSMDDSRVRPLHASWNNVVLPYDHPWWDTHSPPCGWGCRCWAEPTDAPATAAPNDGTYDWRNPSTGEIKTIPKGIDPGWDYNPGTAPWGERE